MTQQRSLAKIRGLEYNVNKLQDNIANVLEPLLTNSINFGIILKDIVLDGVNPSTVNHLLTRQPQGWIIIDRNSSTVPFRTSWNDKTITLNASSPVTFSIYIF